MTTDFLIAGAGVIGLGTALELLQRGAGVTVLERGEAGHESSWAGGGILSPLCPWDYPDEVTRLTSRGAALFPSWAKSLHETTGIDPEYDACGMLLLPPFDAQKARQWCAGHDVRVEEREGDALFLPRVAQVRNPRLMRALRKRFEMLGGSIVERCEVRSIVAKSGKVQAFATDSGEFGAKDFIVAAGAWSRQVLGRYALQLDIKPMRGQMLLFKFDVPPLPHVILQGDLYLIPRRDGHLLVGSTLEDVGFDKGVTQEAYADLRRRAEAILPQLRGMPLVQHWAGLRPGSPHNIPVIGRHPQLQNLYLNSGHFRYGVTMAVASVEILLNEIDGAPQPFDVSPYRTGWGNG